MSLVDAGLFLLLLAIVGIMSAVTCLLASSSGPKNGATGATGAGGATGAAGSFFAVATYTGGASFTIASSTPSTFYRLEGGGVSLIQMPAASTTTAGTEYIFELMGGGSFDLFANGTDHFTGSIITGTSISRGTQQPVCTISGASAGDFGTFISDGISTWLSSGSTAGAASFT